MPTERDPIDLAVRALRHRDRSRRELDDRLAQAGFDEAARADALEALERLGYLDDGRFAIARATVLAGRGYGDDAIRHDLDGHGIAPEVSAAALAELAPEDLRARELVRRLGGGARTASQLARKGFGRDAVASALAGDVAELDP